MSTAETDAPRDPLPGEGDRFVVEVYPDRDAWLTGRSNAIGGSDAPALWANEIAERGGRSYGSPLALYAKKTGAGDEWEQTIAMRVGQLVEPVIAQLYEEATGDRLIYPGPFTLLRSRAWPWMTVSLDRAIDRVGSPTFGVLEAKNRGVGAAADWREGTPLDVQVQIQHAMAVTGWSWGVAAALVGGNSLVFHEVARDEDFIEAHVMRCDEMEHRIETLNPPPADGHPATSEAIGRLFPKEKRGVAVALPETLTAWVQVWEETGKEIARLETARAVAENKLKQAIGSAEIGELPGGLRLSLRTTKQPAKQIAACEFRVLRRMRREKGSDE